jgi:biotin-dependent carboxylase-like uncharacterized protein
VIEVVRPGLLDLVVDGVPRRGLRYGLSEAGPADLPALAWANRVVGNPPRTAALEMLMHGPVLAVRARLTMAVAGGGLEPLVDGEPREWGRPFVTEPGAVLTFRRGRPGLRAYLAIAGGLAVPEVFGSRGADLPAELPGLAGRALRAGDRLPVGASAAAWPPAPEALPASDDATASGAPPTVLHVLPGPQWPETPPAVRRHLLRATLRVTPQASRVGIVLEGDRPAPAWPLGDMVSDPTVLGSVQWTPAGRPVVLLVDRGSLGGYPKPLQVIAADAWRAAQLRPGDAVRFERITRVAALGRMPRC